MRCKYGAKKIAPLGISAKDRKNLVKAGIEEAHAAEIQRVAYENDAVVVFRGVNTAVPKLLSEGRGALKDPENPDKKINKFVGKDFPVKGKSSEIPPIAGCIPLDVSLAKNAKHLSRNERKNQEGKIRRFSEENGYESVTFTNEDGDKLYKLVDDAGEITLAFYDQVSEEYYTSEGEYIDDSNLKEVGEVKVLANEKGQILVSDYDLADIGFKKVSTCILGDKDKGKPQNRGERTLTADALIDTLHDKTEAMVKHGADSRNPNGFDIDISESSPYTAFTPGGSICLLTSEKQYVKFINQQREKGYNLIANPLAGFEVKKNGDIYLPKESKRYPWKQVQIDINNIYDDEQRNFAQDIMDFRVNLERRKMMHVESEAKHAFKAQCKREWGGAEKKFETKFAAHQLTKEYQKDYKAFLKDYKSTREDALEQASEVLNEMEFAYWEQYGLHSPLMERDNRGWKKSYDKYF